MLIALIFLFGVITGLMAGRLIALGHRLKQCTPRTKGN